MDLKYIPKNLPSLCIPRVFINITEDRIRHVFDQVGLGLIDRIDIVVRKSEKGDEYKRVFIHFSEWFWNKDAQAARTKLISGKEIKLVYDDPWFWKISANNWQATSVAKPVAPRPRIEFEEEEARVPVHRAPSAEHFQSNRSYKKQSLASQDNHRYDCRAAPRVNNSKHLNPHPLQVAATLPIAPTLSAKPTLAIAPALQNKPISRCEPAPLEVVQDSNNAKMPAKRSLKRKPKSKKEDSQLEFEEGEIMEVNGILVTQEENKEIQNLYGDL